MAEIKYNTAPAFRNTFFDLLGDPLFDGQILFSKASDHGTRKAVYKTNKIIPPAIEPEAYANPIICNLAGAASVPPIFFASDENYFIEIYTKDQTIGIDTPIQTIDDWNAPENLNPTPGGDDVDVTNYMSNADFAVIGAKKYVGDQLTVAPILLADPAWFFSRSNTNATISVEFEDFILGQTDVPNNPSRKFKYECSSIGGAAETFKDLYLQIEDVRSLSGQEVTLSYNGRSDSSSSVEILVSQYFGSTGSAVVPTSIGSQALSATDAIYTTTFTVPSINGKTVSPNDEVGHLQVIFRMPLNQVGDIELTIFQLNRGNIKLEYNYKTLDQTNTDIITLPVPQRPPRKYYDTTGAEIYYDWTYYHTSDEGWKWAATEEPGKRGTFHTSIVPKGWLTLCPGGTTGTYRKAEMPRLYDAIDFEYGPLFGSSTVTTDTVTLTNYIDGNVTDISAANSGYTVAVTQQGTAVLQEISTIKTIAAASITPGSYFEFSSLTPTAVATDFAAWITIDGAGVPPILPGKQLLHYDVAFTDDAEQVAAKLNYILSPIACQLPNMSGYYERAWDHGAGIDLGAASRLARPDGTTGDNPGTRQLDEVGPHDHPYSDSTVNNTGTGLGTGTDNGDVPSAETTSVNSGLETNVKNIYVHYCIKY